MALSIESILVVVHAQSATDVAISNCGIACWDLLLTQLNTLIIEALRLLGVGIDGG